MRRNDGLVRIGALLAIAISFNIAYTFSRGQFRVRFVGCFKNRYPQRKLLQRFKEESRKNDGATSKKQHRGNAVSWLAG